MEETCSGSGSYDSPVVVLYVEMVNEFISSHRCTSEVDLGCGDADAGLRFECCDIVSDELHIADMCVIGLVFQHLSNSDIQKMLNKVKRYRYVLVSEDVTKQEYVGKYNDECSVVNVIPMDE